MAADKPATRGVALNLRFIGGNPHAQLEARELAEGQINYLLGNDPARWQMELPRYLQVVYREVWPGVDVMLRGQGQQLKYEFRVRPGARLADLPLAYEGPTSWRSTAPAGCRSRLG